MIFKDEFSKRYSHFKRVHLSNLSEIGFSCKITKDKLYKLTSEHDWKSTTF